MTTSNNSNGSNNPAPNNGTTTFHPNGTITVTLPAATSNWVPPAYHIGYIGTINTGGQITWTNGTGVDTPPQDKPFPPKQQKVKRGNEEGYECTTCNDFFPMADLNMPEGAAAVHCVFFTCYACRKGLNPSNQRK